MSSTAVGGNLAQYASAISATASSGYRILKIDGYSRTKGTPTGELIKSHTFNVGGHRCFNSYRGWGEASFITREDLEKSKHLKDDSFVVRCDISITNEFYIEKMAETPTTTFISVPPTCISTSVTYSKPRKIDMEAHVFKTLLFFIYTDSLPEMNKEEEGPMSQHLLVAADRYNLERLKLICEHKLCKCIEATTLATILALAEQHHCQGLKKACFNFLSSPVNLSAVLETDGIEYLNTSCPSVTKELIAKLGLFDVFFYPEVYLRKADKYSVGR
ncbi:BTB/POZ and MATH domain-containing protein 1-like [Panicum miliaceum]|uniref:BTB/POZ and MATH domain-containing protein 1-like n=1 Tax=Panicum miliaceum TaxID=4540 RepID=A0A3L6Q9W9_PANMI|nr:BTB/POZ and MATH domain-containing protein 1-like [Panicum miliaceum]